MTTREFYEMYNGKQVKWVAPGISYGWKAVVISFDPYIEAVIVSSKEGEWTTIYQSWLNNGWVEVIDDKPAKIKPLPLPG